MSLWIRKHKVQAMTLTEIMVVLAITAIITGLSFMILRLVQKNMYAIQTNYEYRTEIQSLETALTIGFHSCTASYWNALEQQLTLRSPLTTQNYKFYKDSIRSDIKTYVIQIDSIQLYFQGKTVAEGEIDAIRLHFNRTTNLHRSFIFRYNDPSIHFAYGN
ncbi:type II secretion system protein [Aquimarina hainanensis]|uniref:Type II secretion system protein n=1 Tax=Aquimarina hainanensis TaxID=1578017 RepID=A0ABW5N979_9FLAO